MNDLNRRTFIKGSAAISAGLSHIVHAENSAPARKFDHPEQKTHIPLRAIGDKKIRRLLIGGNPFSYIAHSEPIIYSDELFKHYLTHEKIVETLILGKNNGIDTFLGRIDENVAAFLQLYRETTGQTMPWIAQTGKKPHQGASKQEIYDNIRFAADHGAVGCYLQGVSADYLVEKGKMDDIEDYLEYMRKAGMIAGVGAHDIATIEACEKEGIETDFYMKTLNSLEYCCPNYERTVEFMSSVTVPWIAFKVLAAGRMKADEGYKAALDAGADFLCVGMFDFQVERNAKLAVELFADSSRQKSPSTSKI
jgi:hypothetical protein